VSVLLELILRNILVCRLRQSGASETSAEPKYGLITNLVKLLTHLRTVRIKKLLPENK